MRLPKGIEKRIWIVLTAMAGILALGSPALANLDVSTASLSFGSQTVGSSGSPQTVTLKTTKNRTSILGISVSGGPFSVSSPTLPYTLYRGDTLTVTIIFAPTAPGTYSGLLTFQSNNNGAISVGLSGIGTPSSSSSAVAPSITSQPASVKIMAGQTATFTVAATGTSPMTFQWRKNSASISGATSSAYTTPAETTTDNNAAFTVIVGNSAGSATSNAAMLTVNSTVVAPTISTQPANTTVTAGQTATFTVAATGTSPMTYQWSRNGASISGATSASYTTPAETTTDNNAKFAVSVANSAGSVTSNSAVLTVNAAATGILNSSVPSLSFGPVNVSASSSQNVTLTNAGNSNVTISNVTVSGAGFTASGVSTGQILTPGQKATLTATFAPATSGNMIGSVAVASNATNSPDTVSLSGTGVAVVNHSVALSWALSTSSVIGYNTYSSTTSGGPYTKLNNTPAATTGYTDNTVQAGLTYYYVVTSVNSSNEESVYSNQVTAAIP